VSYAALLTDTCRVVRRTAGAFDPGTGGHGAATDTEFYNGPCRIEALSAADRIVIGEEAVIQGGYRVFLPFAETDPKPEDVVIVTASENAAMVNRELVVVEAAAASSPLSDISARWLLCEDIQEGP
jgi:hypothetical protein